MNATDTQVVHGIKSYPLPLAKAMEELVRDVANFELHDGCNVDDGCNVEHIQERAESLVELLNKWL